MADMVVVSDSDEEEPVQKKKKEKKVKMATGGRWESCAKRSRARVGKSDTATLYAPTLPPSEAAIRGRAARGSGLMRAAACFQLIVYAPQSAPPSTYADICTAGGDTVLVWAK
jgi:hypothetical protein